MIYRPDCREFFVMRCLVGALSIWMASGDLICGEFKPVPAISAQDDTCGFFASGPSFDGEPSVLLETQRLESTARRVGNGLLRRVGEVLADGVDMATQSTQGTFADYFAQAVLAAVPPKVTELATRALELEFPARLSDVLARTLSSRLSRSLANAVTPAVVAHSAHETAMRVWRHLDSTLDKAVTDITLENLSKKAREYIFFHFYFFGARLLC